MTSTRSVRQPAPTTAPTLYLVEGGLTFDDPRPVYPVRFDAATGEFSCPCGDDGAGPGHCPHVAAAARHAVPPPSDPRFHPPGEEPFPDWVQTFRRHQWEAIEAVQACFDEGAKVVVLQAPVGTGKTLTAEANRRLVDGRGLYVCSTKTLQAQAARDFPYARVLKGRANYPTLSGAVGRDAWGRAVASPGVPDRLEATGSRFSDLQAVTAADCTAIGGVRTCRWCDPVVECPYRLARDAAASARLAILNTAYFLTDANKGSRRFVGRDLAIMDEADLLEGELLNQVEVVISRDRMRRLHIDPPPRKTVESTWAPWIVEEAAPKIRARLEALPPVEQADPRQIRERRSLAELVERLDDVAAEIPGGGWVYDGYDDGKVIFRPVEVDRWGHMLWPHARRFLLMSGSIISADEMASSLGLESDYRFIDIPMTFPAANRPVRIVAAAEMSKGNRDASWPRMAEAVAGVLALHPDERILVHTVSYPLTTFLAGELRRRGARRQIVTYGNAGQRDAALEHYRTTPAAVLIAPSMDRGVDLPGDLCRVQVITKVPYPYLGDKRTSARLYGTPTGRAWYSVNTVRTLVQMTGRGVRSEDDHAVTYILDHSFTTNLWAKNRRLFPGWWCEALDWRFPVLRLRRAARGVPDSVSNKGPKTRPKS